MKLEGRFHHYTPPWDGGWIIGVVLDCFGKWRPRGDCRSELWLALWDSFITCTLYFFPSSVSLSLFILAVPMLKCLGKHFYISSTFL